MDLAADEDRRRGSPLLNLHVNTVNINCVIFLFAVRGGSLSTVGTRSISMYIYSKALTLDWLTSQQSWTLRVLLRTDRLPEMGGGYPGSPIQVFPIVSIPPPLPIFGRLIGGFTAEFKYALYEATRNNNKQKTMKNWLVSFLLRGSTLHVEPAHVWYIKTNVQQPLVWCPGKGWKIKSWKWRPSPQQDWEEKYWLPAKVLQTIQRHVIIFSKITGSIVVLFQSATSSCFKNVGNVAGETWEKCCNCSYSTCTWKLESGNVLEKKKTIWRCPLEIGKYVHICMFSVLEGVWYSNKKTSEILRNLFL
jgi:hypothetical protein